MVAANRLHYVAKRLHYAAKRLVAKPLCSETTVIRTAALRIASLMRTVTSYRRIIRTFHLFYFFCLKTSLSSYSGHQLSLLIKTKSLYFTPPQMRRSNFLKKLTLYSSVYFLPLGRNAPPNSTVYVITLTLFQNAAL